MPNGFGTMDGWSNLCFVVGAISPAFGGWNCRFFLFFLTGVMLDKKGRIEDVWVSQLFHDCSKCHKTDNLCQRKAKAGHVYKIQKGQSSVEESSLATLSSNLKPFELYESSRQLTQPTKISAVKADLKLLWSRWSLNDWIFQPHSLT